MFDTVEGIGKTIAAVVQRHSGQSRQPFPNTPAACIACDC